MLPKALISCHKSDKLPNLVTLTDIDTCGISFKHCTPLFAYFRIFLNTMTNMVQNLPINGKVKMAAWDSDPGPQDDRQRRID